MEAHWLASLAKFLSSRFSERLCLKNKVENDVIRENTQPQSRSLRPPHEHTGMCRTHPLKHVQAPRTYKDSRSTDRLERARTYDNVGFVFQMFLSSLLSVITIIGAVYCMLVSLQALAEGPLICNSQANSTVSCEFSLRNLR